MEFRKKCQRRFLDEPLAGFAADLDVGFTLFTAGLTCLVARCVAAGAGLRDEACLRVAVVARPRPLGFCGEAAGAVLCAWGLVAPCAAIVCFTRGGVGVAVTAAGAGATVAGGGICAAADSGDEVRLNRGSLLAGVFFRLNSEA